MRQEILDAAEAARVSRAPILVTYRASGKKPKALQFRVTSIRSDLDPPVVLGYLHQSRGRRQLRADRILAIEPLDRSS